MAQKDTVELICNVGELTSLFESQAGLTGFLQKVVSLVAYHMKAAACSVYLYDEDSRELILTANQGLNPDFIGKLRFKLGEGITGLAMQELRAIREGRVSQNPAFKFIPNLHEEQYQAFLAVPILHGNRKVGVLVVQDPQPNYFTDNDVKAFRAIAAQLASTIENAKMLMSLHEQKRGTKPSQETTGIKPGTQRFVHGASACEGIAIGHALRLSGTDYEWEPALSEPAVPLTEADFLRAIRQTEEQLAQLQRQLSERMADIASLIFDAHILILKDDEFSGVMLKNIRQGTPPEQAIREVVDTYLKLFANSTSLSLQEKVHDVRDVSLRLMSNLRLRTAAPVDYRGQIVLAENLLPSDLLKLSAQRAEGIILIGGGVTAHVSVLARTLRIPMVILKEPPLAESERGAKTMIILDADQGNLMINPSPDVLEHYHSILESRKDTATELPTQPTTSTRDGRRIRLMANINLLSELPAAQRMKAEGIGLYRSEFPFIVRNDVPTEEEQYRVYRRIIESMPEQEVILRTLDVGGDKLLTYYPGAPEANPCLGLRAIRFSLRNKDMFMQQLRAMLHAGADRPLNIMFPLIASLDDFRTARAITEECIQLLKSENTPCNDHPRLGVMIEVPSAVELAGDLARESDFLCIGSNDLIQYTLAVDRTNERIADLYVSHHPAVLRSIMRVINGARAHGKPVSLCGDMATDQNVLPVLIGLGLRTFSMDPRRIPAMQAFISKLCFTDACLLADEVMEMGSLKAVEDRLGLTKVTQKPPPPGDPPTPVPTA
ncbi:MAG: phosphoenolpyruvate--protein phosphotransferase [bacterium]